MSVRAIIYDNKIYRKILWYKHHISPQLDTSLSQAVPVSVELDLSSVGLDLKTFISLEAGPSLATLYNISVSTISEEIHQFNNHKMKIKNEQVLIAIAAFRANDNFRYNRANFL